MEPKKIKNPTGMLIMHGTVIAVVLYMAWQLVRSYRAGGAEAPSLTTLIVGLVLLVGGCVVVGWLAVRLILLLDVEMPGMSGIDLAKRLRGAGCRAEIIFITSHFECMAEGYEVDALHYLVKPVPAEKLRTVLDRAAARLAVEPPSVVIACEEGNVKLYESELLYAESFLHDLVLHTTGPDYRIRESISAFAGRLSADFFRTHRSYLVNLKAVVRIGRTSVLLRGGAEVPLARGKYDAINRAFIDRN